VIVPAGYSIVDVAAMDHLILSTVRILVVGFLALFAAYRLGCRALGAEPTM